MTDIETLAQKCFDIGKKSGVTELLDISGDMTMTQTEQKIGWMTEGHVNTEATSEIRCKNCIYCKDEEFVDKSTCRESPPYFQRDGWSGWRRWPEVDKDEDWCGKFKHRSEQVGETTDKNSSETVLKYALEKINDGIVKDGNSARTSLTLFEIKAIVETALASVGSSQKEKQ